LTSYGIRVNAVAPGVTNTAMPRLGNTEEQLSEMAQRMPTGRLAEPDDIADAIVFLATDDARHIIGQLIHVNGGDYLA
jgi:NAD(P)-dependent dehydrogenase (short-subunit alcohol dehydrogenase family)